MVRKYRVWCTTHNEWETDRCFLSPNGSFIHISNNNIIRSINPKTHPISFAIGKQDKHGNDIYEGDKVTGKIYELEGEQEFIVRYEDCGYAPFADNDDGLPYLKPEECEITGNVFEDNEYEYFQ